MAVEQRKAVRGIFTCQHKGFTDTVTYQQRMVCFRDDLSAPAFQHAVNPQIINSTPADIVVAIDNIYFVSDNVLTGITSVEKSEANNSQNIYTLDGRKVKNPRKGVYIVDGKKVMIK